MYKQALLISANNNVSLPQRGKIHLVYMIYTYHPTLLGKVFSWQSKGCQQNLTFWLRRSFCCQPKTAKVLWEPSSDPKVNLPTL